jgi:hypothetical protein
MQGPGARRDVRRPRRRQQARDGARRQQSETIVVGLLAAPGLAHEVARELARELPRELRWRFPEVQWEVDVEVEPMAAASGSDVDLVSIARDRMLAKGWKLAICLTDLPLNVGSRPVTAHASVTHGVGLVSVPAFGPVGLERRLRDAVLRLIEGLLGESSDQAEEDAEDPERRDRIRERLEELAAPVGRAEEEDRGSVRFVTAVVRGNLRLLGGMVRANRPWRLVAGLSRALVAALGVDIFGIASPGVWLIADGMGTARLVSVCLASIVATCVSLVVAHRLWESARQAPLARERVVLFNLVTWLTVAIGVVSLYLMLFVINVVGSVVTIAPAVLRGQVRHGVDLGDYVELAWLVTSLATLGGALGAALENHEAVQSAAYTRRLDERTEAARYQQQ